MIILSLFDGKSSGYTACELAGIPITQYFSSEIDTHAIKVSNAIHPNQIRLGDVTRWREWDIPWADIDLVIAGSPCQGFSMAGLGLAFDDPRSKLFFELVDIIGHINRHRRLSFKPRVKFMLENVKMSQKNLNMITEALGVNPIFINSALVSAQNRQRYYWFNWHVEQPEDRGIYLRDVLEVNPDSPTFMSEKFCTRNAHILRDDVTGKARSLSAMEYVKNGRQGDYINHEWYKGRDLAETARYRKLTPRECFRLQTVPEHYIDKILSCGVSNTQLYKIAGNGWNDETIAHIFRGLSV